MQSIKKWYRIKKFRTKMWAKAKISQFIRSKFFLGILMLSIGVSYTVSYYEFKEFEISFEGKKTVFIKTETKERIIGEAVPTASSDASVDGSGQTINEETETVVASVSSASLIEKEIETVFGEDSEVARAVFKTESDLSPTAMNWNCRYEGVSKQCKPEDREKAWSVDCGVAQINYIGKDCPEDLFDYKNNIRIAKGMFDKRGFQPWVTFNEGYYLANL